MLLHGLFEQQVKRTPDLTAVIYEGKSLSYEELDKQSTQLASYLCEQGVVSGSLVALYMHRAPDMVVALLAILKAGAAYIPLDTEYPKERLSLMLDDADPVCILTQAALEDDLASFNYTRFCVDRDWSAVDPATTTFSQDSIKPDDLAYVIYTSGSTGIPKGVMNTHQGICNRLQWMQDHYQLNSSDRVLQKTPYSFDVSVWEFFWPIMTGACMVLARPDGHKDSTYMARLIQQESVSIVHFVPSMLRLFLDETGLEVSCQSLRHVICSGEALLPDLRDRFFSKLDARLHNLYGPTEAAVDVTWWECQRESREDPVPIGWPVSNTSILILDETLQPVADGETGEICIGGIQVARGYLNRPELTRERFIENPVEPGQRLYRTGDLGRKREDGAFEFLGRIDFQVKIRGIRTELGEIELHLEKHPSVKQAVVLLREDKPGNQKLVAYLVLYPDKEFSVKQIRDFVEESLPEHMVPSVFMLMEDLPLTVSGKLDRKALPMPGRERPVLDQPYVAASTGLEKYLVRLWREELDIEQVGVHDRFFDLGGTSLQAAAVIGQLQKDLGEFIYVLTLFESPTVAAYSRFLARDYPEAIHKKFGSLAGAKAATDRADSTSGKIDNADIERMQSCIVVLPEQTAEQKNSKKNPPAIFILAPPRSGTTLLRVMLAGHPDLFAAAELQLLGFNTLQERKQAYSGKYKLWREGTVRAIMEIKSCDADQATAIMSEFEDRNLTTQAFFAELQEWLGDKMLVDKSPSYGLDKLSLEKAEQDFDQPLYIHLVRHPYAMVNSFVRYHMEQVLYLREQPFTSKQLGELVWLLTHKNIVEFLEGIPQSRYFRIRFEDMVKDPAAVMGTLCQTLGLSYHENLINPYTDIQDKMVDGLHKVSIPMGDTNLLGHKSINPKVADSWQGVLNDNFLSEQTWKLATRLGYEQPAGEGKMDARPGKRRSALANRRQRKQKK